MKNYIAFDVGGTNIKYGILSEEGGILKKFSMKTSQVGQEILDDICNAIKEIQKSTEVSGAAFSIPGFIDVETGTLNTAGALMDLYGLKFKEYIENKVEIRVEVDNDVNCVALAEKWLGNAKENTNFLCMTIGTGIGGAIFIDDKLYRGSKFAAGEFGYMLTDNCFPKKEYPTTLSTTGSVFFAIRKKYSQRKKLDVKDVSGEEVFARAANGDSDAKVVIDDFYNSLAIGIYNLIFIFNPEKILLGGAISARDELLENIQSRINKIVENDRSLRGISIENFVELDRCKFNNDSGMIGALYHYLRIER